MKSDILIAVNNLSYEMDKVSRMMEKIKQSHWETHATELKGGAELLRKWGNGIEKEIKDEQEKLAQGAML